jgi:hypothetical protein
MHSRKTRTLQIKKKKTSEDTETSKYTQRGLQQTTKYNKGEYRKRYINKEDNTRYEKGVEQRYGNLRKNKQEAWK